MGQSDSWILSYSNDLIYFHDIQYPLVCCLYISYSYIWLQDWWFLIFFFPHEFGKGFVLNPTDEEAFRSQNNEVISFPISLLINLPNLLFVN